MKKLIISLMILFLISFNINNITVFSQKNDFDKIEKNFLNNDKWDVEIVDSIGESGWYSDIKIISDNEVYISYYERLGGNLKIAKKLYENWFLEIVDSSNDVGKYSSIAIDSENKPHISYFDETNKDLKYAKWTGSEWVIDIIDSYGDVGYDSSIAIDNNDLAHISYYDSSNGDLKYAKWNDTDWIIEIADSTDNIGAGSSIILDYYDNPHISYANVLKPGLLHAYRDESGWTTSYVDINCKKVFGSTSIALDSKSIPHLAYFDVGTLDQEWSLKHAYWGDNEWKIEIIDPDIINFWYDWGVSIASGDDDIIHIAYYKWPGRNLNYAWRMNNLWSKETVDSEGAVGSFCSIDIKTEGYPSISYMDRSNLILKYADKKQYSPTNPEKPYGLGYGLTGKQYTFITSSTDYDDDKISYGWDWGDDQKIEWTEYYNSGEIIKINHTWNETGIFQIKVKAKDENGNEGNWSEILNLRIIKKYNQSRDIKTVLSMIKRQIRLNDTFSNFFNYFR